MPGETTFAQMPGSALQPTVFTGCGQGREGGKEPGNGWEKGTKGPVVSDAHKQLPQLLKDKGQSSISSSCGSKRNHVLDIRRLAAGSLILGPYVVVLDSCGTISEPRFHGPHCAEPTTAWSHAGDLVFSQASVTGLQG